jgi:hypothetical protein
MPNDFDNLYNEFVGPQQQTKPAVANPDFDNLYNEFVDKGQAATQAEAPTKWWQGLANDPTWAGLAKRVGISGIRGMADISDTALHGVQNVISTIANKTLPENLSTSIRQGFEESQAQDKALRNLYNKEFPSSDSIIPNTTDVGRMAGQAIATAPVMPIKAIQVGRALVGALPTISATGAKIAAPLINRLAGASVAGGIGGATLGATTASTSDDDTLSNVGKSTLSGMIAGPALGALGSTAKAVGGKLFGNIGYSTAELAKRAEELGINLKATQVSSSPLLKKYDQVSGMLPFSGAQGTSDTQIQQFTRAVSRTFGQDTSEITPQVIADARKQIGGNMENIYKGATVKVDKPFAQDLQQVIDDAQSTHADSELKPVMNQVKNVISKIDQNGEISGDAYHGLTKYNAVLSKAQQSANPNIANSANQVRNALEDVLFRNLPADQQQALSQARSQYKAAMTVKPLVDQSAEGYVSPLKLMQKVINSPGGKLRSGELGELADIGRKFFPTPSDSGTPLGTMLLQAIHDPKSAIGAAGGALYSGAAFTDVGLGGMGLAANRLIRSAVNSKMTRNAIIRGGMGETYGNINKLTDTIAPYSAQLLNKPNDKQQKLPIALSQ